MKVLIVEDEKGLCDSIFTFLSNEQYTCEKAFDFSVAIDKVLLYEYDCIVLDINLPDGNGLAILKELKESGKMDGVLIISARNAVDDKVSGLRLGADDYLTKPFHLTELAARVAAIIRRRSFNGKNIMSFDELVLDTDEKTASISSTKVDLTRKEYDMLLYLIINRNKVVTKGALTEHLWGDGMENIGNYDFLYSHIKNLRKKLVNAGAKDYIKSVYGLGYKFSI